MFRKLSLENFKCFTNDTINFRNITIFTGANATGKSSVIQSILLYEGAMRTEKGEIISVSDAVHVQVGSPKSFVAQNAVGNDDYDFRIGVDDRRISFYVDKENGLDLRFDKECERYGLEISYLNAERITENVL